MHKEKMSLLVPKMFIKLLGKLILTLLPPFEGQIGMNFYRFIWNITFLVSLYSSMVNCHGKECSFGGIDLQHCLDSGNAPFSLDSCCVNLNQAVQAGYHCLCSLLGPSNPLLITKISLLMSNCYISMPSQCHGKF
ncbi:Hypothetical predicted protein [Olea europaea subsp. europaea]|uniref:Bifunctional inhibitor/plant lipid transfer protein/seed storage helical domain-containing protein n=1 Tax=Olea europaea subsp. europaea TaxID=158383 RepID=A0A8S0T433_OLEEU|nr:Hypothetical predicted protein [Olea europaea subsp. europaea]